MQSAEGLVALQILLLALLALGHCGGVLLAAGSLHGVQRWLDTLGRVRGFGYGRGRVRCTDAGRGGVLDRERLTPRDIPDVSIEP